MEFEIEGMDELIQQLENIGDNAGKYKKEALTKAGKILQDEVKKYVPVDTGNLKEHIMLSDVENDTIDVYVDQQGKAYYGVMVEEGTSKMRAQPYMFPSFQKAKGKIRAEMIDVLRMRLGLMP